MKHDWPEDPEQHVWGPWLNRTRTTQYRKCVHPKCNAFETRETAKA